MTLSDLTRLLSRCDGTERLVIWMRDPHADIDSDDAWKHYDVIVVGLQPRKGETRLYFTPSDLGQPSTEEE